VRGARRCLGDNLSRPRSTRTCFKRSRIRFAYRVRLRRTMGLTVHLPSTHFRYLHLSAIGSVLVEYYSRQADT
jgi:hypothetical protein